MEEEQLLDTWNIHNRVNLYMLDAIAPEALGDVSASKGRSVGEEFAHIHNVRLMWLKSAAPELLEGQEKIEKEQSGDKAHLLSALAKSGEAIVVLLRTAFERGGRIKGFKAACRRVHGVPDLARVLSPWRDRDHPDPGRSSTGQESFVRTMGMGRALTRRPCSNQSTIDYSATPPPNFILPYS
jgi:DinB family